MEKGTTPKLPDKRAARRGRGFCRHTGFVSLDRLLQRLHANKAELLAVPDHPDIPLHTNGSENDIRCQVTKRKVNGNGGQWKPQREAPQWEGRYSFNLVQRAIAMSWNRRAGRPPPWTDFIGRLSSLPSQTPMIAPSTQPMNQASR